LALHQFQPKQYDQDLSSRLVISRTRSHALKNGFIATQIMNDFLGILGEPPNASAIICATTQIVKSGERRTKMNLREIAFVIDNQQDFHDQARFCWTLSTLSVRW
jgi:hypothetical protein